MFSAVHTRAATQLICEAWVDTTEVPPFPSVCLLLAASGPAFTLSRAREVQEGRFQGRFHAKGGNNNIGAGMSRGKE